MPKIRIILPLIILLLPFFCFADNGFEEAENLFNKSKFSDASQAFSKIIQEQSSPKAYRRRANCFEQTGEYERALSDYAKAIEEDKTCFEAYYDKALLLYNTLHRKEDSLKTLTDAIKIGYSKKEDREPLVKIHLMRSYIYKGQDNLQAAVKDLTHVLYYSADPVYFMMRGELRQLLGQFSLAKIDFKKAISLLDKKDKDAEELLESLEGFVQECELEISASRKAEETHEPRALEDVSKHLPDGSQVE